MVWSASEFSLSAALLEENFRSLGVFAEAAAETADKFRSERLENETIFVFDEGHLRTFFDGVLAAKLCGDDQLAFGGDSGDFGLHGSSRGRILAKYNGSVDVGQCSMCLTLLKLVPRENRRRPLKAAPTKADQSQRGREISSRQMRGMVQ